MGKRPTGLAGAERERRRARSGIVSLRCLPRCVACRVALSAALRCLPRCLPRCPIRRPARADRSGVVADLEAGDLAERREHKVKGVDLPWAKPQKPRPHRS